MFTSLQPPELNSATEYLRSLPLDVSPVLEELLKRGIPLRVALIMAKPRPSQHAR